MKKLHLKAAHLLLGMAILLTTTPSMAQTNGNFTMLNIKQYVVRSNFNHKTYQLDVSLPKNYSSTDTVHYPVLYVLDGQYNFTSFYSIRAMLDLGKEIKDVIIVAIDGNKLSESDWMASRFDDFTPSSNPGADSMWAKLFNMPVGKLKSGGAASFLSTIQEDIIPYIDKQYRTNNTRGLFGHSLGGLFAAYCLLSRPGLFQEYSINSPSLWWNNGEMLSLEHSFLTQNPKLSATVFISVGALEGPMMVSPVTNFADSLKDHFAGIQLTRQVFDNETHLSVVSAASTRTLKVFYVK